MTVSAGTRPVATGRIAVLDGLRGCAILLVVISHVRYGLSVAHPADKIVVHVMAMGWVGVDLFFVLSGFLVTGVLLDSRGGNGFYANFYRRRVLRIFPLYYCFLALVVSIAIVRRAESAEARMLLANAGWYVTYLVNVLSLTAPLVTLPWGTGPLWTLAVEEHFYLVWPVIIAALRPRRLAIVCVLGALGAPVARALLLIAGNAGMLPTHVAETANYVLSPLRADALLVGGLLAILHRGAHWRNTIRMARWSVVPLLVAVTSLALVTHGLSAVDHLVQVVGYSLLALIFVEMLALVLAYSDSESRAIVLLRSPALVSLGRYSYAIYLLHTPVLLLLDRGIPRQSLPRVHGMLWPGLLVYAVAFITWMWGIGWLSFNLFERQFLDLRERYPYTRTATELLRPP